ncbi:hypothetical protein FQN60_010270 [Etheostoma spectabile]|uniref:Cadherin domain-containing protein n=1 Tax=Etheostoma spectabile TaxID=54343 RepID=A0A5J5D8M8_9PERO|nr:hypothetical protein FQN60_010270 [Etheostoma spectabile]
MAKGSLVGNIAQDLGLDVKRLKSGKARIYTEDNAEYIELNKDRGALLVKERIDREALCGQTTPCALHLQITLEDPIEFFTVTVEINDINDNAPSFKKDEMKFRISESAVIGAKFVLERAMDLDVGVNGLQGYSLKPTDNFNLKFQNQQDGSKKVEMVLQKHLDREAQDHLFLTLTAVDGGDPQLSGTMQVEISVLDANDNAPVFTQEVYKVTIMETATKDTILSTVSAVDADQGSNGKVSYSITNTLDDVPVMFQIDEENGVVVLSGTLDYEKAQHYEIHVQASDDGGLTDSCKIIVEVTDTNDNHPYSIPEEMEKGSLVCNIAQDLGLDFNRLKSGRARIHSGDSAEYIELNRDKGVLLIKERIDRETLCGETTPCALHVQMILENPMELFRITIEITDLNDNPPSFASSEKRFEISESAVIGSKFVLERAIDADIGVNDLQGYSLNPTNNFELKLENQADGSKKVEMVLQKPLDREYQDQISLLLTALDGGQPRMSGTMQITVNVLDANDNAPVFTKSVYKSTLTENSPRGTNIITVSASDKDGGSNGEITYAISNSKRRLSEQFQIDRKTGEVILIGEIDYEKAKVFQIDIEAIDNGGLSDSSKILIDITDVNDNCPQLKVLSKSDTILEDSPENTVIAMLRVNDPDFERNGDVKWRRATDVRNNADYHYSVRCQ